MTMFSRCSILLTPIIARSPLRIHTGKLVNVCAFTHLLPRRLHSDARLTSLSSNRNGILSYAVKTEICLAGISSEYSQRRAHTFEGVAGKLTPRHLLGQYRCLHLFEQNRNILNCSLGFNSVRSYSNKSLKDELLEQKEKLQKNKNIQRTKKRVKVTTEKVKETLDDLSEDVVMTVPNMLTMARMVSAPVIGYLVLHGSYSWALGFFVFAGITDLLDGYIARNFKNQSSAMGSFIDPLADKLLVSVLFITLTMAHLLPVMLTTLVITRDALLITAAFYVRYISLPPPRTLKTYFNVTKVSANLQPTFISKLNTTVQLSLVALTLAAPVFGFVDHSALHALWYLTATTTIWSGISYVVAKDTFKIVRKRKKN